MNIGMGHIYYSHMTLLLVLSPCVCACVYLDSKASSGGGERERERFLKDKERVATRGGNKVKA